MTKAHIKTVLVEVLREVQEISGRACPTLGDTSRPIGDLEGFDSLAGVETTVLLEERLGRDLGVESLFVSATGTRALKLTEIVDVIAERCGEGVAA